MATSNSNQPLAALLASLNWSYAILWTPSSSSNNPGLYCSEIAYADYLEESAFPALFSAYIESCRQLPPQHGLASKMMEKGQTLHWVDENPLLSDQTEELLFFQNAAIRAVACVPWGDGVLELGNMAAVSEESLQMALQEAYALTSGAWLEDSSSQEGGMLMPANSAAAAAAAAAAAEEAEPSSVRKMTQRNHMLAERRRRRLEREHLATLKELLPFPTRRDKVSILEGAIRYVRDVQPRGPPTNTPPPPPAATRDGFSEVQLTVKADEILPQLVQLQQRGFVVNSLVINPQDNTKLDIKAVLTVESQCALPKLE